MLLSTCIAINIDIKGQGWKVWTSISCFWSQSAYKLFRERMHCTTLLLGKIHCQSRIYNMLYLYCSVVLLGCATSCKIPKTYKPLCGTNGISYTNLKALQCHNKANPQNSITFLSFWILFHVRWTCLVFSVIRIAYKGRCLRPDVRECNFSSVVKNVCGNDGLTYLNPAMIACKNKLQPKKRSLHIFIFMWIRCVVCMADIFMPILDVKIVGKGKCKTNTRRRKVPNKMVKPSNVTGANPK